MQTLHKFSSTFTLLSLSYSSIYHAGKDIIRAVFPTENRKPTARRLVHHTYKKVLRVLCRIFMCTAKHTTTYLPSAHTHVILPYSSDLRLCERVNNSDCFLQVLSVALASVTRFITGAFLLHLLYIYSSIYLPHLSISI